MAAPVEVVLSWLQALPGWEALAVVLAVAYLLLAIRQNPWCWAMAIASTSIYLVLMYSAGLYMESALQLFYIAIAIYGWHQWLTGGDSSAQGTQLSTLPVRRWPWQAHALAIPGVLIGAVAAGWLLSRYSPAALPYLDSFTTFGAIVATWMVARKILENWLYWFVIDSVSIYLYISRELYLTAALFCGYLVLIVFGYRAWHAHLVYDE